MINDNDDEKVILLKKAQTFREHGKIVHVKYKNGIWKRGIITLVSRDFFFMQERLEGEVAVFFLEIKDIELFREVEHDK